MCTRYVLLEKHYRAVLQRLGIEAPAPFPSRYNIAPGRPVPVVRRPSAQAGFEVTGMAWGWSPPWARGPAEKLVNIRAESIAARRPFRDALQTRRCLIPATGFYEWQKRGSARQPFFFRSRDGEPFGLAALWQPATVAPVGDAPAFAVITTEPNELVRPVHDRMPVLLPVADWPRWLAAGPGEDDAVLGMLRPARGAAMEAIPVSPRMNNVRYEAPDCIDAVDLRDAPAAAREAPDDGQAELGL